MRKCIYREIVKVEAYFPSGNRQSEIAKVKVHPSPGNRQGETAKMKANLSPKNRQVNRVASTHLAENPSPI